MYALYQCPKCMLFNTEIVNSVCSEEQQREYEEHIKTLPGYVSPPELTFENVRLFLVNKYKNNVLDTEEIVNKLMNSF